MICPNCRTRYYSQTHCPNCGQPAFSLNKGRRTVTRTDYKHLYKVTAVLFLVVIVIALFFLGYIEKSDIDKIVQLDDSTATVTTEEYGTAKKNPTVQKAKLLKTDDVIANFDDIQLKKLNMEGINAYNKKEYSKSLIIFMQAHAIDSENKAIKANLYNTLVAIGGDQVINTEYSDAIKSFNKAITYVDNDYIAFKGLGVARMWLSEYENSLSNLLTSYEINPDQPRNDDLKLLIAKMYFKLDDYENAKKFVGYIEQKEKYAAEIINYTEVLDKNISDTSGKKEAKSSHFRVFYDGYKAPVVGNLVSIILEEAYYSVGSKLDYYPKKPVQAILNTQQEFEENMNMPKWVGALFDGKIRIPVGGVTSRTEKLLEVLKHEYTHAAIFAKAGNNCPLWLNEGLAQIFSGAATPSPKILKQIVKREKLPELRQLHGSFIQLSDKEAYISYTVSMLFTQYLIDRFGMNTINNYLNNLKGKTSPALAFKNTFYSEMDGLFNSFIADFKTEYE